MITLQLFLTKIMNVKNLITTFISFFTLLNFSFANEKCKNEFEVLKREKGSRYKFEKVMLENLNCNGTFEGKYFKIVESTSDLAISINADDELMRKAATTYHYLTSARNFWIEKVNSDYVKNLPQLTIRINMSRRFSKVRHFTKIDSEINNAWTIPAGETPKFVPKSKKRKWGNEIWFSPKKTIDVTELIDNLGYNPVTSSLKLVEEPIVDMAQTNMVFDTMDLLIYPEYADQTLEQIVMTNLVTIGTIKGVVYMSTFLDRLFVEDEFYIDTALVPEIIFHEFNHIALSDQLNPTHSSAVIEGMADYFVASAFDKTNLYSRMDEILLSRSKNADNKKLYRPEYELPQYAREDFTLGVLWKVKEKIIEVNHKRMKQGRSELINPDTLIYASRVEINQHSQIGKGLTQALVNTCKRLCKNPRLGIDIIRSAFSEKGFN